MQCVFPLLFFYSSVYLFNHSFIYLFTINTYLFSTGCWGYCSDQDIAAALKPTIHRESDLRKHGIQGRKIRILVDGRMELVHSSWWKSRKLLDGGASGGRPEEQVDLGSRKDGWTFQGENIYPAEAQRAGFRVAKTTGSSASVGWRGRKSCRVVIEDSRW